MKCVKHELNFVFIFFFCLYSNNNNYIQRNTWPVIHYHPFFSVDHDHDHYFCFVSMMIMFFFKKTIPNFIEKRNTYLLCETEQFVLTI